MNNPPIAALVLAAGASRRMGQPKQLLLWGSKPLVQHMADTVLAAAFKPVYVVTGAYHEAVEAALKDAQVVCVHCSDWDKGMGASLQFGLKALLHDFPSLEAVCITPADLPMMQASDFAQLKALFWQSGRPIAAMAYRGALGAPAVFFRSFFPLLLSLEQDQGARRIIAQYQEECAALPCELASADVDTWEDWEKWKAIAD